jgi:hypothetical protein
LDNEDVFVLINDEAAEEIAFGIDDTERCRVWEMLLPYCERSANALFEEGLIYFDAFGAKDADIDSGFGIVEADAQKTLAMVFDLNQFAVGSRLSEAKNRAVVNPGMAGDYAVGFTGF